MDLENIEKLRNRIGDDHLGSRLRAQVDLSLQLIGNGKGGLHFENIPMVMKIIKSALIITGASTRGQRNALNFTVTENHVGIADLPTTFIGMRILQLSDLHIDSIKGFGKKLAKRVSEIDFDLCVLTGDFRFHESGEYTGLIEELRYLMPALSCRFGTFGILGNHDFIEQVPQLEEIGIKMLINEAAEITNNDDSLWIVGIDDPHLYGLHDIKKALQGVTSDGIRILLAHSPEIISEASQYEFNLYLSGHTHGGQICLPGGWAPLVNANAPRSFISGSWEFKGMSGYTSRGVGSSGVFARFYCPPEIVIHQLETL